MAALQKLAASHGAPLRFKLVPPCSREFPKTADERNEVGGIETGASSIDAGGGVFLHAGRDTDAVEDDFSVSMTRARTVIDK